MFNFSEDDFVPGFRMKDPKGEVPGFRMAPDGSTQQSLTDIWSSAYRRALAPESWPTPGGASNQASNLTFRFGGGLPGPAVEPTWPSASSHPSLSGVEPVAAGDLRCQGYCSQGGDRGTTGAYRQGGDVLCAKCLVKRLGYENMPSSELPKLLEPWTLDRK